MIKCRKIFRITLLFLLIAVRVMGEQPVNYAKDNTRIYLDSQEGHAGSFAWKMRKAEEVEEKAERVSQPGYNTAEWLPAVVPGTVLHSLVYNKVYPEPYYGLNNKIESGLIPDIAETGRDFYTYWFRTEFDIPESYRGKTIWLEPEGINYRAEVWINGNLLSTINGMFTNQYIDITEWARVGETNALAVKVYPVDMPGEPKPKQWGAPGEFRNGGNGNIGLNTTMLMSVGWDFTFMDGIRDRNTGIWKSISLYTTGKVALRHPFIKSELNKPGYDMAKESISVEVVNTSTSIDTVTCLVKGEIIGEGIFFEKAVRILRGEELTLTFTPDEFPQLVINQPRLWWPVNKGSQNLYEIKLTAFTNGVVCDSLRTKFGIREIISDRNTPDRSRVFYVNGKRMFIRGTNWIPEGNAA